MGFIDWRSWYFLSLMERAHENNFIYAIGLFGIYTICDSSSYTEAFENWQYKMDLAFTAKTEEVASHAQLDL